MSKKLLILLCILLFLGASPIVSGDWNEGDPFKWVQYPDLQETGIDVNGTAYKLADDFLCTVTGPITDFHIWSSWYLDDVVDPMGVDFIIEIWDDIPASQSETGYSMPGNLKWTGYFPVGSYVARKWVENILEGWWDPGTDNYIFPGDTVCWQYNFIVDPTEAFRQEGTTDQPVVYWVSVQVVSDLPLGQIWGWKTSLDHWNDDAVYWDELDGIWKDLRYPFGHPFYPESMDLAFVITGEEEQPTEFEYGDAPEGANAIAYPSLGIAGSFPTCKTVGPAGYIEHNNFGAYFGPTFDFEADGNAGACPTAACFPPYDQDECFNDGDAGLIMPDSFTIDSALNVVTCTGVTPGTSLGTSCATAIWGTNIDINVTNNMPSNTTGYVNVLADWDQSGNWAGSATGACTAPEYILVDFPVPNGYSGPLSGLMAAGTGFTIGPKFGYAWVRFSITERPINNPNWDGSGVFEDGETEDYLLKIDPDVHPDELDWGDAPDSVAAPGYPTYNANSGAFHIIDLTTPWLGTQSDAPDNDPDGQPDATATGDDLDGNDDENGVVFPPLVSGATVNLSVDVWDPSGSGGSGVVEIWIDYNINTSWEASELVFSGNLGHGNNTVTITVPNGLTAGTSFARCRISTAGTGSPTGGAGNGEVEDYEVFIEEEPTEEFLKFQQLPLDGLRIGLTDYYGHDELSTVYNSNELLNFSEGCYMADDFADMEHSPVIRVKWWGSYLENEIIQPVSRFLIAFESDIPAIGKPGDIGYVPSHPGEVLSSEIVYLSSVIPLNPGEYSETPYSPGGPPCYEQLFEYEAVLKNPFPQDPNTVYWLKIVAIIDDPTVWLPLSDAAHNAGMELCEFLRLPYADQAQYGLEQPVTRWGWHNRDYTKMDPYAATPPAVVPGEHNPRAYIPTLPPISGLADTDVWHFQDDAVTGDIAIDASDPIYPAVNQPTWEEQYYKYSLPYCATTQGVDGPDEIAAYSKDLAFELWTNDDCFPSTDPAYPLWVTLGKPQCWCDPCQAFGDANGDGFITSGDIQTLLLAWPPNAYEACSDFNHDGFITSGDIQTLLLVWGVGCP